MHKEHFVCIVLCEIFILSLLCHTFIGCQHVSTVMGFLSNVLASVLQEDHFVCILHCDIFINIVMSCLDVSNTGIPRSRIISNRVFHIGLFVSSFVRFVFYHCHTASMLAIWGLLDQRLLSTGFFKQLSIVFTFMRECSAATEPHSVLVSRKTVSINSD